MLALQKWEKKNSEVEKKSDSFVAKCQESLSFSSASRWTCTNLFQRVT